MIVAKNEWKNVYNISSKNIAWQGMLSAISSIFQKKRLETVTELEEAGAVHNKKLEDAYYPKFDVGV